MKKTVFLSLAFIGALLGASVTVGSESVSAVSGNCYYGPGTCSVSGVGECGTNDVLPGRNTSCGGTPALNAVNTKSEFINKIIDLSNDGGRMGRGAKFIMRETTGTANAAEFRRLLEQSNVDIVRINDTGVKSSWYDPVKDDFFYDNYPSGWSSRPVIKIKQNGNVKSVIEVWCGNMSANVVVEPPPNTTIRPHIDIENGPLIDNESARIHAWVNKDGPDTRSDWNFVVWYDQDGDGNNNQPANVIATDSGATNYNTANTDVKDQQRTIDGTKNRICARLNLSNPRDNNAGGNTNIANDPAQDCENIVQHEIAARTTVRKASGGPEVTALTVTTGELVQFRFYFKNIGNAPKDDVLTKGEDAAHAVVQQGTNNFAGTSAEKVIPVHNFSSNTPGTYCFHPSADPWRTGQGNKDFTAVADRACVTVVDQDVNPTGWISKQDTCLFSDTNHQISYGGIDDGNGGNPQAKVTTSSASANTGVVHGPSTGGVFTRPHGVVTYYLWVENINTSGASTGYVNIANVTTTNPLPCPVSVEIDPDARLTDTSGNILPGGTVAPGTQVRTLTRVYNNGNVSTNSQWTREFWYDDNGNSRWDSGETRITAQSNGGPTTYNPLVYTSVAGVTGTPSSGVDGTKTRICVSLNLHTVASSPNTTVAPPNPQPDCKAIATLPNELTPDVDLSASILEPGQQLWATAEVECDPGTTSSSSNYHRIFWYENGGNPSRYDVGVDQLVTPGPSEDSNTKSYCAGATPFATWGPRTVPLSGVTRACTSLQLSSPSANATIPPPGIAVDCADVATKFFFQATLGDVNAAACLYSGCTHTDTTISAFNTGAPSYRGSGSQIGAFAIDSIDEFTSGNNASFEAPGNPKRLTFANSTGVYGGRFSQSQHYQITNYWTGLAPGNATVDSSSPLIVKTSGHARIMGSRTVGSVGVGNVPNLQWVIAEGNIYIDNTVTELHGIYIAKGNIYTCANGFAPVNTGPPMANNCTNPLKINGALVAGDSVKLQRVRSDGGISTGLPSEIIEYNPFTWIQGINPANQLPTTTSSKLDFITTLPPIL